MGSPALQPGLVQQADEIVAPHDLSLLVGIVDDLVDGLKFLKHSEPH